ncbi:unnamed protein product [Orchesella dallaii]|uniref:Conotoxin n=1 Tax=Orchesella dallaii TaxID=48710 RepID=A0ABP1Q898_9HEXA
MVGMRLTITAVVLILVVTSSVVLSIPPNSGDVAFESVSPNHKRLVRQAGRGPRACSYYGESCASRPCCEHPTGDIVCYNYNKMCGPLL